MDITRRDLLYLLAQFEIHLNERNFYLVLLFRIKREVPVTGSPIPVSWLKRPLLRTALFHTLGFSRGAPLFPLNANTTVLWLRIDIFHHKTRWIPLWKKDKSWFPRRAQKEKESQCVDGCPCCESREIPDGQFLGSCVSFFLRLCH